MSIPNLLSIAGSDPSGGAGIQADLKVFGAFECYGMAALTALTAQNTQGVVAFEAVSADFVKTQIAAVFADIAVDAVKIGMLGNAEIVEAVAETLAFYKPTIIVLDPVMVATSGDRLVSEGTVEAMHDVLIPLVDVITPNIPEGEVLLRKSILDMERGAQDLADKLGIDVLLKGGHLKGPVVSDILVSGDAVHIFDAPRVDTVNTHGTGCSLSSALAACLAHGMDMAEAVSAAKEYVLGALVASEALDVGSAGGHGPLQHFWELWERE